MERRIDMNECQWERETAGWGLEVETSPQISRERNVNERERWVKGWGKEGRGREDGLEGNNDREIGMRFQDMSEGRLIARHGDREGMKNGRPSLVYLFISSGINGSELWASGNNEGRIAFYCTSLLYLGAFHALPFFIWAKRYGKGNRGEKRG